MTSSRWRRWRTTLATVRRSAAWSSPTTTTMSSSANWRSGTTGYEILLKETDPALVKLEIDAGWVAAGGADPAALIAANAERVKLIHFKDFSTVTPPINELGPTAGGHIVDLGTGVAPLKAAYEAARKAGTEYFIVDHDPPFHGKTALEAASVDYAYVAGLMKA